ncbi:MAG: sodium:calcium antiporter [Candidatus Dormibacteria bacterium]
MGLAAFIFVAVTLVSLAASWFLVARLERVGARLGWSEAVLGLVVALAADTPEITSAVTALLRGQHEIGAGVVLGSTVFNLAFLLGVSTLIAGRIRLHRRVLVLAGGVALWMAVASLGTTSATFSPLIGLVLALTVFVPYVTVSAWPSAPTKLAIPKKAAAWIGRAISDEESELIDAIHPLPGDLGDGVWAAAALVIVVAASATMEGTASALGTRLGLTGIEVGGLVLAAVTSLPNAVGAIYLAVRGRGSAVLSEALNSNNFNVVLGFLVPAVILGLGRPNAPTVLTASVYASLTVCALALAYVWRGLGRLSGMVIVGCYVAFVAAVILT